MMEHLDKRILVHSRPDMQGSHVREAKNGRALQLHCSADDLAAASTIPTSGSAMKRLGAHRYNTQNSKKAKVVSQHICACHLSVLVKVTRRGFLLDSNTAAEGEPDCYNADYSLNRSSNMRDQKTIVISKGRQRARQSF
eukprot:GHVQ01014026.1.p3 GENE.GHVQ01014026.1~~GHVQ01014026.1.p3  ORF type:complete len:139 (-),score=7.89 GHVQ01014026.1:1117-1533(-)